MSGYGAHLSNCYGLACNTRNFTSDDAERLKQRIRETYGDGWGLRIKHRPTIVTVTWDSAGNATNEKLLQSIFEMIKKLAPEATRVKQV